MGGHTGEAQDICSHVGLSLGLWAHVLGGYSWIWKLWEQGVPSQHCWIHAMGTRLMVFVAQGWDGSWVLLGVSPGVPAFLGGLRTKKTFVPVAQLEPGEEGGFARSSALLSILRTELHLGWRPHQAHLQGFRTRGDKALTRINHRIVE